MINHGMACDIADMDDARMACPNCNEKHGLHTDMYTDGLVNFCGYCYTRIDRDENTYPRPDPKEVQKIFQTERNRMVELRETELQISLDQYWDIRIALHKTDSECNWTARLIPHRK